MTLPTNLNGLIEGLPLKRLGDAEDAGLWMVSLPLPRHASAELSLNGVTAHSRALGQWHDLSEPSPRRALISAQADTAQPPAELRVSGPGSAAATAPPTAEMVRLAWSEDPLFVWENHAIRISWGGRQLDVVMGLRTGGEVHWWEAANLLVAEETASCRTIEAGGAIPLVKNGRQEWVDDPSLDNPILHHHNWLNGHLMARLHSNGVCEVYAHHINSKFFDDGLDLEDAVAVVGLRVAGTDAADADICGSWDGSQGSFSLGDVAFDATEVARLATPEQPGDMAANDDGFLVWQPYAGVDIYGGWGKKPDGSPRHFIHAEDHLIPRGMARTLRFSFSMNPARSPRIARFLAPAWWYGLCEEFSPASLLPVSNSYDATLKKSNDWLADTTYCGGFEDGSIPRNESAKHSDRYDPGWEGEIPYTQLLAAWRNGDGDAYYRGLRQCYYYTDVGIDHAAKVARMPGYWVPATALPHFRIHACAAAYLETGDDYCLNTARAVLETGHWLHRNSWPRPAVGRDSAYLRGAVFLYRFFGYEQFREMAKTGIGDVAHVQRPNGSFGDQGGGTGIHQIGTYITKPWMGLMAVGGALDYLELFPDDEQAWTVAKKLADWLVANRFEHGGGNLWTYQHDYFGGNEMLTPSTGEPHLLKHEKSGIWHQEYLARLLGYCSRRTGDPAYLQAWSESYEIVSKAQHGGLGDHPVAQALQFLPWLQDRLWNVALQDGELVAEPLWFGDLTPTEGMVETPNGPHALHWSDGSVASTPADIQATPVIL